MTFEGNAMKYRLEVDSVFNCRAHKGERKAKDGTGRLVKCAIYFGSDFMDCLQDARAAYKAGQDIAPGYAQIVEVRGFDNAEFNADPLRCKPRYRAQSLA